jgi:hypothetical protein
VTVQSRKPNKLKMEQRPPGVPVGDEDKFREWFVQKMVVQIAEDANCQHLLRLEGSVLTLLEAIHSWRQGTPFFRD